MYLMMFFEVDCKDINTAQRLANEFAERGIHSRINEGSAASDFSKKIYTVRVNMNSYEARTHRFLHEMKDEMEEFDASETVQAIHDQAEMFFDYHDYSKCKDVLIEIYSCFDVIFEDIIKDGEWNLSRAYTSYQGFSRM